MTANAQHERQTVDVLVDLERGAAAGALAGFAASAVMNGFQYMVTPLLRPSSAGGPPATEQAADRVALLISGARLDDADRKPGGTAVHYVVGTLTGALYGSLAEARPGVARWKGMAFGLACATLVDQLAVPLTGLARPPWRYTLRTHLYGYISHVVFGVVTEAIRKRLRERPSEREARTSTTLDDVSVPLLLGLTSGQRTFTAPTAVTIAAASSGLGLEGTPLRLLSSPWAGALMSAAAVGEYVIDKRPGVPPRISPPGLTGRLLSGALSGAAAARPGKAWFAAGVGAAGALVGSYVSYRIRMKLAEAFGRDKPVAFAEDALAVLGSAAVASYAAMRQKQREAAPLAQAA
ncbi:DUF1440 domain-containing protein [Novosphingobium panipatense]|uniref:DUF1440 domain-containing protein n=1 Tax=Novosphingobium TaxID=165696 RepID=UPI000CDA2C42|nr:DUF1440 domain-containing protein [Novosphingobium sp. HII-3]